MARDTNNQHVANYGGFVHDFGFVTFSGTNLTLEVDTVLGNIKGVELGPALTMASASTANYYLNETVGSSGIVVDGDGQVTLTRVLEGSGTATSNMKVSYHFIGTD